MNQHGEEEKTEKENGEIFRNGKNWPSEEKKTEEEKEGNIWSVGQQTERRCEDRAKVLDKEFAIRKENLNL